MYKIGIDEAGRGPWLGPVVACSLAFNPKNIPEKEFLEQLKDSKKLSQKTREKLFNLLIEKSLGENPQIFFGVGVVDNFLIDEINIKQANKEAMKRSLIEILRKISNLENNNQNSLINSILVDGNDNYCFDIDGEQINGIKDLWQIKPIYIIKGDEKILEISASSIIAKVFRDKLIGTYSFLYPNLNLENHKGYGTKKHIEYLENKTKITGIHRISYKPIKNILLKKPKLLLHICCGPDASIPIIDLKKDYEVICFWYDPNIHPKSEYDKRFQAFKKVCEIENVEFIEGEYDTINFFQEIKGLEKTPEMGEKCEKCYDMRLKKTSILAKELGIKYWTSTLNTSPHKDLNKLFNIGEKYSLKDNLNFLKIAFRKNNGFLRSVKYCEENNIYRQNYCGCIYSDNYPFLKEDKK